MKRNQPFLIALAVSLLLHVVGLVGPIWLLPNLADLLHTKKDAPLEARLMLPPAPAPAATRKPARKPKPPRPEAKPTQPSVALEPVAKEEAAPPSEPVAKEKAAPPSEPVAPEKVSRDETALPVTDESAGDPVDGVSITTMPTGVTLPNYVRITYRVSYGDSDFTIGKAVQEFQQEGTAYTMRSHAQTTGLIGLFRPAQIITTSKGEVRTDGLRPIQMDVERRNVTDTATFNWKQHLVSMPGGAQVDLPPGTQDMLSLFVQLSMIVPTDNVIALPVLTTKGVERHEFAVIGEETVSTGWGDRRALHLSNVQANGIKRTSVWLGLEDGRLPIKIRITDRKGDTFVQTAESILTNAEGAF